MAQDLHFLMIPLMCPGHIIPMLDMAKLLAQRSVRVTVVITLRNAIRYGSVLDRAAASGLPIQTLQLRFPATEAGLPEGCESLDDLPNFSLAKNFFDASALLQQPLEQALGEIRPRPNCIISDKNLVWTSETAKKFQIPCIIFDGRSCFSQVCTYHLCVSKIHKNMTDTEPFVLPGLPDCIKMTKSQLPGLFNPGKPTNSNLDDVRQKVRAAEVGAYGLVINSFEELEKRYVDEYRKMIGDKVWCIGPLSLSNKSDLDKAQRGTKSSIEEHGFLNWLDSQKPGNVIYACLGSLTRVTLPQFMELALGLEASNFPFVLVVKGGSRAEETEKWLNEEGFEERVKGRGVLVRGWAPQVLILSHPAVGGFLTHCGWNSTIEGVCAGVPMITWPLFSEQFFNERLVVQVLGTGVSVGARRVVNLGEEEAAGVQVTREDVLKAVKTVMDEGREGEERRKRAKDFGEMAKKAVEEGGSSQLNITLLIQDIMLQTEKGLLA